MEAGHSPLTSLNDAVRKHVWRTWSSACLPLLDNNTALVPRKNLPASLVFHRFIWNLQNNHATAKQK